MHRDCFVCGEKNSVKLYTNQLAPLDELDMSYEISHCTKCENVYASDIPQSATYEAYYNNYSKYDHFETVDQIPKNNFFRAQYVIEYLQKHLSRLPKSCLDLGCGAGVLLHKMQKKGIEVCGFDIAPKSQEVASRLFDIENMKIGSVTQLIEDQDISQFEVISCMAILEHMPMLNQFLDILSRNTHDKQYILINVPYCFDTHTQPQEILGELSIEHINFFNESNLSQAFARHGFKTINIEKTHFLDHVDVMGLFQKSNDIILNAQISSYAVKNAMQYIEKGKLKLATAAQQLKNRLGNQEFYIFGAGSHTARFLPHFQKLNMQPILILDNNSNLHNKHMGGIQIVPTIALENIPKRPIFISSFRYEKQIRKSLIESGHREVLSVYSS